MSFLENLKDKLTTYEDQKTSYTLSPELEESLSDGEKSSGKKAMQITAIVIMLGMVGGLGFYIWGELFPDAPHPKEVAVSKTALSLPKKAQIPQQKNASSPFDEGESAVQQNNAGPFAVNPFIDSASLPHGSANNIPGGSPSSAPLPAIPSGVPTPSVGSVPLPSIPSPDMIGASEGRGSSGKANAISGIAKSSNGKSVAIMGDGRVLEEGDRFGDNRVAYIGGDGIQLDDGNTIGFNQ